jgi:hypothetical protein
MNPNISAEALSSSGDQTTWGVVLTKELWKKGVWCVSLALCRVAAIDKKVQE